MSKDKLNREVENSNKKKQRVYNYTKTRKKPKPRYRSKRDYDFLQYIRIVFKWATENYDLTRPELELLLYLYPMGTFTKYEFFQFTKTVSMYQNRLLDKFIDNGYIHIWRTKKGNESRLYALTNKAKTLCSRMHKFCTGEINMPESPRFNNLAKNDDKRINGYYMDIIKKMNKNRD